MLYESNLQKSQIETFEEASRIALNVDSVLRHAQGMSSSEYCFGMNNHKDSNPTPMDLGNLQRERSSGTSHQMEQRKEDMKNGACFTCHKLGCRPWKHRPQSVNNRFHESGTDNDIIMQDEDHTEIEQEN